MHVLPTWSIHIQTHIPDTKNAQWRLAIITVVLSHGKLAHDWNNSNIYNSKYPVKDLPAWNHQCSENSPSESCWAADPREECKDIKWPDHWFLCQTLLKQYKYVPWHHPLLSLFALNGSCGCEMFPWIPITFLREWIGGIRNLES